MPVVRKLSSEEVEAIRRKGKSQRQLTTEDYDRYLSDFGIGDWGEVDVLEGEKRMTVRKRLEAAAERRGIGLAFGRTRGDTLRFKVTERAEAEQDDARETVETLPPPVVSSDAPPKPRSRGRRKAQATTSGEGAPVG